MQSDLTYISTDSSLFWYKTMRDTWVGLVPAAMTELKQKLIAATASWFLAGLHGTSFLQQKHF